MTRFELLALLAGALAAAPAAAQTATQTPAIVADATTGLAEQQRQYGEWVQNLHTVFEIGQRGIEPVSSAMQAVMTNPNSRTVAQARDVIGRARKALAEAGTLLERLDAPELPALRLPPEIDPVALRRGALGINAIRVEMIEAMSTGLTAVEKLDIRAFEAANAKVLTLGMRQVEMAALLVDARAAAVPTQPIDRSYFKLLGVLYRSHARIRQTFTPSGVRPDAGLASALEALAMSADDIAARGREENEANLAQGVALANTLPAGQAEQLDRLQRVRVMGRELFARGTRLAAELRDIAADLRKAPLTAERVVAIGRRLVLAENELADIQHRITLAGVGGPFA